MARPLPIITQHYLYPLQPAQGLDFATEVGKAMVTASPARLVTLNRIYMNMTAEAKARCDFARSWLIVEGGTVQS